ncbi:MAG: MBL fold metallo-hydrolase, partial [Methanobacteriaceae archaeon]|nr:MBL fold metallo-hydrolase [Methanobacteriaceae archaeon]
PCDALVELAKGADILIHESTFGDEDQNKAIENWHSTAKEAAEVAKKAEVKKLILTHISTRYKQSHHLKKSAQKIFENTIISKDFMVLKVNSHGN